MLHQSGGESILGARELGVGHTCVYHPLHKLGPGAKRLAEYNGTAFLIGTRCVTRRERYKHLLATAVDRRAGDCGLADRSLLESPLLRHLQPAWLDQILAGNASGLGLPYSWCVRFGARAERSCTPSSLGAIAKSW